MKGEGKDRRGIAVAWLTLLVAGCVAPPTVPSKALPPAAATLRATSFSALPGWQADDLTPAWEAFQRSCAALRKQATWQEACAEAAASMPSPEETRRFFESRFLPYQVVAPDGSESGLITGYYEPLLRGSRSPSPRSTSTLPTDL